jgi:hypothetical protein
MATSLLGNWKLEIGNWKLETQYKGYRKLEIGNWTPGNAVQPVSNFQLPISSV